MNYFEGCIQAYIDENHLEDLHNMWIDENNKVMLMRNFHMQFTEDPNLLGVSVELPAGFLTVWQEEITELNRWLNFQGIQHGRENTWNHTIISWGHYG